MGIKHSPAHLRALIVMVSCLCMANVAPAGLVLHADPVPISFNGVDFVQFTIWVEGTEGDVLRAWEGRWDGPMNQLWFYGVLETPTLEYVELLLEEQAAADTHLMVFDSECLVAEYPSEDNDGSGGLLPPPVGPLGGSALWGTGSWLAGEDGGPDMAFALMVAARKTNRDLAQIVVPVGESVRMVGRMNDQKVQEYPVDITIPEPATLALLALGGIALVNRRR